jgi:hypothetical protein
MKPYPLVYSVDARFRRASNAIALSPLALVISLGCLSLAGLTYKPVASSTLVVMFFFTGLWAVGLASPAHRRVVLYEDSIEVIGWFSSRKLRRSEILGRRMGGTQSVYGPPHYVVVPADKTVRVLSLPPSLEMDKDFRSWMDRIPEVPKGGGDNNS